MQNVLNLKHKEKFLFECIKLKSFMFGNIKMLVKILYFFCGKNNLFDLSYKDLKSVNLLSLSI